MIQEIFREDLQAQFSPIECEDFDKPLSQVTSVRSLHDSQREFERLGNRVQGWMQKALVGAFIGGLKSEILVSIQIFKPETLKEAISLACMEDNQL